MKKIICVLLVISILTIGMISLTACGKALTPDQCMEEYISKIDLNKRYDYLECQVYLYSSVSQKLSQEEYILQEGNVYTNFDDLSTEGLDAQVLIKKKDDGSYFIYGKTGEEFTRSEAISAEDVKTFTENIYTNILFHDSVVPHVVGEITSCDKTAMNVTVNYIRNGYRFYMSMNRYTNKIHQSIFYHKSFILTSDTTAVAGKSYYTKNSEGLYVPVSVEAFEAGVEYYEYLEDGSFTMIEYTYPIAGYNKTELPNW